MSFDHLLQRERSAELLRFMTCGAVDHGKSTVIGRLLLDSRSVPADTLAAAKRATARYGAVSSELDLALLVDGLRAEREQGITIDVAFRYFSTTKRKFVIADVPGHSQYTRNMATAASVSDLALLIVDVGEGVVEQSRRHAFLAALFGIKHLVVAVNKMDAASWSEEAFRSVRDAFTGFAARLEVVDVEFIPVAASTGDNIVTPSGAMPWYSGRPLLDYLENVHISSDRNLIDLRLPVQLVLRAGSERYLAGSLASGVVRAGESVAVLPSRERARVTTILRGDEPVSEAFAPMAITVKLDRPLDVSRGDVVAHVNNLPSLEREFEAMVVWMNVQPLDLGREYLLKHAATTTTALVTQLRYSIDVNTLRRKEAATLEENEIGRARLRTGEPIAIDAYARNRVMGAFILIDRLSNVTLAAGLILDRAAAGEEAGGREAGRVTDAERAARAGHRPIIVVAKSDEEAFAVERRLFDAGHSAVFVQDAGGAVEALARVGVIPIVVGDAVTTAPGIDVIRAESLGQEGLLP